jgi:hypothetical protein
MKRISFLKMILCILISPKLLKEIKTLTSQTWQGQFGLVPEYFPEYLYKYGSDNFSREYVAFTKIEVLEKNGSTKPIAQYVSKKEPSGNKHWFSAVKSLKNNQ